MSLISADRPLLGKSRLKRLAAIGVWATRPHLSCMAAKEGESPTFILCGCKRGRVALPPFSIVDDELIPHAICSHAANSIPFRHINPNTLSCTEIVQILKTFLSKHRLNRIEELPHGIRPMRIRSNR